MLKASSACGCLKIADVGSLLIVCYCESNTNIAQWLSKKLLTISSQHLSASVGLMQQAYRSSSSTELLKQLHWLPIEWRIRFKLATSTYKTLHIGHPPYLTDLLQYHKSSVSTRSSTNQLLAIPRHNLSFGFRSFRVSALRIWISLTPQIRQCQTLATFRCHLKTHYFQSAFSAT